MGSDRDTVPTARAVHLRVYQGMPPSDRVALAFAMTEDARRLAADGIRARHPEYDEALVRAAMRRVILGDALCRAVWPNTPLVAP